MELLCMHPSVEKWPVPQWSKGIWSLPTTFRELPCSTQRRGDAPEKAMHVPYEILRIGVFVFSVILDPLRFVSVSGLRKTWVDRREFRKTSFVQGTGCPGVQARNIETSTWLERRSFVASLVSTYGRECQKNGCSCRSRAGNTPP